jgi:dipeptidyl aminopeptidase/acylaminoacyl peptidase
MGRSRWTESNAIEPVDGGQYLNPAISPCGDPRGGEWHGRKPATGGWILDTSGWVATRLIAEAARETDPVWSPDGREIAFGSREPGRIVLSRKARDGTGPIQTIAAFDELIDDLIPTDWTAPGAGRASPESGSHPRWSDDGRELFYLQSPVGIGSVALGPALAIGCHTSSSRCQSSN